jgi:hypothetical protein
MSNQDLPDQGPVARARRRLRTLGRLRLVRALGPAPDQPLAARVAALEAAVEENRRLNQRLADVVDVVIEVLVPAVDRDDARLRKALANLNKTLDDTRTPD